MDWLQFSRLPVHFLSHIVYSIFQSCSVPFSDGLPFSCTNLKQYKPEKSPATGFEPATFSSSTIRATNYTTQTYILVKKLENTLFVPPNVTF